MTNEQLDALLDADEQAHPANSLALFAKIHERRRKRAHAKAKESQPRVHLDKHPHADKLLEAVKAEIRKPITAHEEEGGGMDYLLQTVQECADSGDLDDILFSLVRVVRKSWAWNRHLGPIQGVQPEEK
jgi:hypothetical protein